MTPRTPSLAANPTNTPGHVPTRMASHWVGKFLARNPFYLISAALLLFGINRLSVDPSFLGSEEPKLAFNFAALQLYEILLVFVGVVLSLRRVWYDSHPSGGAGKWPAAGSIYPCHSGHHDWQRVGHSIVRHWNLHRCGTLWCPASLDPRVAAFSCLARKWRTHPCVEPGLADHLQAHHGCGCCPLGSPRSNRMVFCNAAAGRLG